MRALVYTCSTWRHPGAAPPAPVAAASLLTASTPSWHASHHHSATLPPVVDRRTRLLHRARMSDYQQRFVQLAIAREALRFGEFKLKSGRLSPYFFNAGRFNDGDSLPLLGECYAAALGAAGIAYDMLYGPAYKGIPLVAATAIALARARQRNVPWAFNRKEAKEHGEAGQIVGTPLAGRVVIVDDVITAGTAIRESIEVIRQAGATPVARLVA